MTSRFADLLRTRRKSAPPDRVLLHIGLPKTGTTFLQRVLWANRDELVEHGWGVPGMRRAEHFEAVRALRGGASAETTMSDLARQMTPACGRWVISEEAMAPLGADEARAAVEAFAPHGVEVVVTVRDLGRALPSAWQQRVKERRSETFQELLDELMVARDHQFWKRYGVIDVLNRWIPAVGGPEHVTVLTVPPPGGGDLWHRFATRYGWPLDLPERTDTIRNESLGPVEIEALRRFNAALGPRLPMTATYVRAVRLGVTRELERMRMRDEPLVVPSAYRPWVDDLARTTVAEIEGLGVDVVGQLDELRPVWPADAETSEVGDDELIDTLVELLIRTVRRHDHQMRA